MYIKLRVFLKSLFYKNPIIWPLIETIQGLIYCWDYFYYYKLAGHHKRFSIKEVNIEFASKCNLRCKFCSLDRSKPTYLISEEILDKFFQNFILDKRFRKVRVINLYNGGEILMHPKVMDMLRVVKKYKQLAQEKNIHFPKIHMLTNAILLKEKLSQEIIELDIIDIAGFSLDGGTPALFEEMRVNAKWSKFYENVKTFIRLNTENGHKTETYSICCIPDDKPLKIKWMDKQVQEILKEMDRYELRRLHNWAGNIEEIKSKNKWHKIGCTLLMRQMVLLPNGDITVCCSDLNSKGVIGNMLKEDVYSIYKSQNRLRYLRSLLMGKKHDIELCRNCETF